MAKNDDQHPEVRPSKSVEELAAAALNEAKEALVRPVPTPQEAVREAEGAGDELEWDDPKAELRNRNMHRSSMWLSDPAMAWLSALAARRLRKVNEQRGGLATNVEGIRAGIKPGTKVMYIRPATEAEEHYIEVNWEGSNATFNLRTLLESRGLTARPGYRYRYAVEFAQPGSPAWPALVVDLSKPLEEKPVPLKKKTDQSPPDSSTT